MEYGLDLIIFGSISFATMGFVYYNFLSTVSSPKVNFFNTTLNKFFKYEHFNGYTIQMIVFIICFACFFTMYNILFLNILIKFLLLNIVYTLGCFLFNGGLRKNFSYLLIHLIVTFNIEMIILVPVMNLMNSSNYDFTNHLLYKSFLVYINHFASFMVLRFTSKRLNNYKIFLKYKESFYIIIILLCLTIVTLANTTISIINNNSEYAVAHLVISATIFVGCAFLMFLVNTLLSYIYSVKNYTYSDQVLNKYDEFIHLNENYTKRVSELKHDIDNNILVISSLLDEGDIESAQNYIYNFQKDNQLIKPLFNTGDTLLNVLLSQKLTYANKHNVEFKTNIEVLSSICINNNHLAGLLFNLLDNAINAAAHSNYKKVHLHMVVTKDNLLITVQNSVINGIEALNMINYSLSTKKSFKDEHGYGLSIINDIVERYNGVNKVTTAKDDNFGNYVEFFIALSNRVDTQL